MSPRTEDGKICRYGVSHTEYRVYIPCRRQVIRSRDIRFEKPTPDTEKKPTVPLPLRNYSSFYPQSKGEVSKTNKYPNEASEEDCEEGDRTDTYLVNAPLSPNASMPGQLSDR